MTQRVHEPVAILSIFNTCEGFPKVLEGLKKKVIEANHENRGELTWKNVFFEELVPFLMFLRFLNV